MSDWWEKGDYNGESCSHCGRERVMVVDAPDDTKRRVCEKCGWDQDADDYAVTIGSPTPLDYRPRLDGLSPEQFRNLYLCEFPPLPRVAEAVMFNGRAFLLKEIEPDGERDRATIVDPETGRSRNVRLSSLAAPPLNEKG